MKNLIKRLALVATIISSMSANIPDYITDTVLEKCDTQAIVTVLALDKITKENLEDAINKAKYNLLSSIGLGNIQQEKQYLKIFLLLKEVHEIKYSTSNKYYSTLNSHLGKDNPGNSQKETNFILENMAASLQDLTEEQIRNNKAKVLEQLKKLLQKINKKL